MADQFITDITKFSKATQDVLAKNGQGMSAEEYLKSRGGVNPVTSKYGDSYNANIDLNDAEYLAAIASAGTKVGDKGAALNAAREKKLQAYIAANPESPEAMRYSMESRAEARSNPTKTVSNVVKQSDGSSIVTYSDGTTTTLPAGVAVPTVGSSVGGTTSNTSASATLAAEKQAERQSAYDLLYSQFQQYGLESLVTPLKDLVISGASPSEFTIKLRETDAYKKRFAANAKRIANGFAAIDEATYLGLEDKYQSIMQNYGLPSSYYTKGEMGIQKGFEDLIGGNVDPITLEERIMEGQKVVNGSKDIKDAIGQFYPGLNNSDFLAYVLDPKNALSEIKRKVTAAEIGGAAIAQGLNAGVTRAEELGAAGINRQQAQQGYGTIAGGLQRGSQLASIYGENPYTQTTAEQEVFNIAGAQEARKQRQKITGLEQAAFGAKTGISSSALVRDRAGAY